MHRPRNAQAARYVAESHNWIKSCILIGLRSEVFSVELRVENEAKPIVSPLRNNWRQIVTQLQKSFSTRSFSTILFNYSIQGKFVTWLVNSALNCTWKLISHSSLRDSCDIGFRVQFNAEFPRQVINFPIVYHDCWFNRRTRYRLCKGNFLLHEVLSAIRLPWWIDAMVNLSGLIVNKLNLGLSIVNYGLRKVKQETTAPQIISVHQTP